MLSHEQQQQRQLLASLIQQQGCSLVAWAACGCVGSSAKAQPHVCLGQQLLGFVYLDGVGYLWAWLHSCCMRHWTCTPLLSACCCSAVSFVTCARGLRLCAQLLRSELLAGMILPAVSSTGWLLLALQFSSQWGVTLFSQ